MDAKEKTANRATCEQHAWKPGGCAERNQETGFPEHQSNDSARFGAKRKPDAQLFCPPTHGIGNHTVETDSREHDRENPKRRREHREGALAAHRAIDLFLDRADVEHRHVRIEMMDRSLDGSDQAGRRHRRSDVQHAVGGRVAKDIAATGHVQHVLIEISEPRRRTVLRDTDDVERHGAVADDRCANRVPPGWKVRLHKILVQDDRTERARLIAVLKLAAPHQRYAHRLEIVGRNERDGRAGLLWRSGRVASHDDVPSSVHVERFIVRERS